MKILLDTDVILDVALGRREHLEPSAGVLRWAQNSPGFAAIAWHTLSNTAYLLRQDVRPFLEDLLTFVAIAPAVTEHARLALRLPMRDFEDSLQVGAAVAFGARSIVTRNVRDYRNSPIDALTPAQFLSRHTKTDE